MAVLCLSKVMDTDLWTLVTGTLRSCPKAGLPLTVVSCLGGGLRVFMALLLVDKGACKVSS